MISRIYAIDPGCEQSALVVWDGQRIIEHEIYANADMLMRLTRHESSALLLIEQVASYGMAVGAEVFETVFWSGRFAQTWIDEGPGEWQRMKRLEVKMALCHDSRAKDANVRQAVLDLFGSTRQRAIGTKKQPGPLYGISGDEWSALALVMTYLSVNNLSVRSA